MMYKVRFKPKSKKGVWKYVRYINGNVKYIGDYYEARYLMRRLINSGYEAQIFDCTNGIFVEGSENL